MGYPIGDSSVMVAVVAPRFSDSSLSFIPRDLEWSLALRDGRSLPVPSKNIKESCRACRVGKDFDIQRITPSADSVNGVLPFSVRGDELHPSSELVLFFPGRV
jgi:hypothetical protein